MGLIDKSYPVTLNQRVPGSSAVFSASCPGLTRASTRYLPSRRSSPMKNAIGTLGRCVSELDIAEVAGLLYLRRSAN